MSIDEPHDVPIHKADVVLTWVNVALGCWLLITPFLWPHSRSAMANSFLTGTFIAWFAAAAMARPTVRYIDAGLGLWLMVSTLIFNFGEQPTLINALVVGGLVVVASFLSNANMPSNVPRASAFGR